MTPKLGVVRGTAAAGLGKTPAPYHCWIVTAGAPAFVAIDGPLYTGGPIWRIEAAGPRGAGRPTPAPPRRPRGALAGGRGPTPTQPPRGGPRGPPPYR